MQFSKDCVEIQPKHIELSKLTSNTDHICFNSQIWLFNDFSSFSKIQNFCPSIILNLGTSQVKCWAWWGIGLGVTSYPQSNHENVCAGQCQVNLDKVNGKYPPLLLQNSQFIFPTEKVSCGLLTILLLTQKLSSGGGRKSSQLWGGWLSRSFLSWWQRWVCWQSLVKTSK